VNVLAHPGLITEEDAGIAAATGVALEVTSRGGHNRTNGHVVRCARAAGCVVVIDSDAHAPGDLLDERARRIVARGAGMSEKEVQNALSLNIDRLLG
jgi:histidinol phosphatase-like PHP family hydrolase